jgi:hypothetical protein
VPERRNAKGGTVMEEKMELEVKGHDDEKSIPWDKLLGVAILGAVGSALLYYVFTQLSDEMKENIKENAISFVKTNVAKQFTQHGEPEI